MGELLPEYGYASRLPEEGLSPVEVATSGERSNASLLMPTGYIDNEQHRPGQESFKTLPGIKHVIQACVTVGSVAKGLKSDFTKSGNKYRTTLGLAGLAGVESLGVVRGPSVFIIDHAFQIANEVGPLGGFVAGPVAGALIVCLELSVNPCTE